MIYQNALIGFLSNPQAHHANNSHNITEIKILTKYASFIVYCCTYFGYPILRL